MNILKSFMRNPTKRPDVAFRGALHDLPLALQRYQRSFEEQGSAVGDKHLDVVQKMHELLGAIGLAQIELDRDEEAGGYRMKYK